MTYFISGHRDITQEEFDFYYAMDLQCLIENDPLARFVVGDYHGVDIMAQKFLLDYPFDPKKVTVYHMFEKPRNLASTEFNISGGYTSDEERDAAMTDASDLDLAWIRKGKEKSGTAQNVLRRHTMRHHGDK